MIIEEINKIEYNYLNLPSCISYANGHVAEYVYDAAGTKRSVIYKVQPEAVFAPIESSDASPATAEPLVVQSRREYCDNHIYNAEGQLNQVLTDNGYIENDKYHFYVKDYQGNNRVIFDQDGTIEQLNHYYPYGGLFSEGTANTNQPYKFGGKELDRMNGLDLYDFGARMLDSATPTWETQDPIAEKYYPISPYAYCGGNPIRYVDPNGMEIWVNGLLYSAGMAYNGKDEFTRNMVTALNVINKYGGGKLIKDLVKSETKYNYKENNSEQSYTQQVKDGNINININTSSGDKNNIYSAVAHESMHGAQYENGQGGVAVWNEVEAYAFSQYISINTFQDNNTKDQFMTGTSYNEGLFGKAYNYSSGKLASSYSLFDMATAVFTFKQGSGANYTGMYNNNRLFPVIQPGKQIKSLLNLYYNKK